MNYVNLAVFVFMMIVFCLSPMILRNYAMSLLYHSLR